MLIMLIGYQQCIQIFQMQFKVKAGRFVFDKQTKKVKVSKQKGLIHILRNQEEQTHFKWANLQTHAEELDIIVFPGDAVFEAVVDKNNTYVLRFGMDDERYFYWLQEKCDGANVVKQINKLINYEQPVVQNTKMVDQAAEKKPQPDKPSKPAPKIDQQPKPQDNFIAKLAQNLAAATRKHQMQKLTALTHLNDVTTPEILSTSLKQLSQQQIKKLLQFLPQQHRSAKDLATTIHSPQFLQALDVLSDALNSQNAMPIFMELGLKNQFLEKHYGVEGFLLGLVDKYKSSVKKQQKKQEPKQKVEQKKE